MKVRRRRQERHILLPGHSFEVLCVVRFVFLSGQFVFAQARRNEAGLKARMHAAREHAAQIVSGKACGKLRPGDLVAIQNHGWEDQDDQYWIGELVDAREFLKGAAGPERIPSHATMSHVACIHRMLYEQGILTCTHVFKRM